MKPTIAASINTRIKLSAFTILLFLPFFYFNENVSSFYRDYGLHLEIVDRMIEERSIQVPHFLYHALSYLISLFPGVSLHTAGYYLVPILSIIVLSIMSYEYVFSEVNYSRKTPKRQSQSIALTLLLLTVSPIAFLMWPNLYFGFIGINVYHNPTIILVKPLSVVLFVQLLKCLDTSSSSLERRFPTLVLAVLTALSLLAKPSYIICLIPAIISHIVLSKQRGSIVRNSLLLGLFLPSALVLLTQYYWAYSSNQVLAEASSIIYRPFVVMSHLSKLSAEPVTTLELNLLAKLLLSILFPLVVYILHWKKAKKSSDLNLWHCLAKG